MVEASNGSLFILGRDYHLGDLLWFTAVLAQYRETRLPPAVAVACPDRGISRILEGNPYIDELVYTRGGRSSLASSRILSRRHPGDDGQVGVVVHDLRMLPIGRDMVRNWRRRTPWLYYRDLWLQPRGQWLATYLGLGTLRDYRPVVRLGTADREIAGSLAQPYVILAPHIGHYRLPITGTIWRRLKGWPIHEWASLARALGRSGLTVITMGAGDQDAVPGTRPMLGLPIRQAAGVIERASGLISGESGLWFLAAALEVPFVIVPWWLPSGIDWAAPMGVPHALIRRADATTEKVAAAFGRLPLHAHA